MPGRRPIGDQRVAHTFPVPRLAVRLLGEPFSSWLFGEFPRIEPALFRARLRFFSAADEQTVARNLEGFRWLRFRRFKLTLAVAGSVLAAVVLGILGVILPTATQAAAPLDPQRPVVLIVAGAAFGAWFVGLVYSAVWATSRGIRFARGADRRSRVRFHRAVGAALATWDRGGSPIRVLQFTGVAARALFLVIQTEQWTWASPPALAERATRLARPLLDIDVPDRPEPEQIALVCEFLIDVTIVVIAGREDLIPEVREHYADLRNRTAGAADRDQLFLDPMRERTRWEVLKDFVLPMASWLSLVVSCVALLVSLSR